MSLHLVFKKLQAEGESARMNSLMDGYKHTKLKQSLVHCIGVDISDRDGILLDILLQ
jgi:hypothetical protein